MDISSFSNLDLNDSGNETEVIPLGMMFQSFGPITAKY